jgi:hypothetical protein
MKYLVTIIFTLFLVSITGCNQLEEGQCKNDRNCKDEKGHIRICYKEPATAEIGKCMSVAEARQALKKYQKSQATLPNK